MHPLRATPRHTRAIEAVAELLSKLRIDSMFVGSVARAAWLGGMVDSGSIDVLGLMQPQQKNQVAMMANNRGFRVDRDEIDQAEELDLIPLTWIDDDDVRVHVLVASNALYARMFATARMIEFHSRQIRVPAAEDVALLLSMSDEHDDVRVLAASDQFDRRAFNDKLVSIGLRELVL
ncbi:MAG TPA: hypothetical protein VLC46_11300 [Thermoanaerobaculia bacterium]|jgi:hypothetical protein|nr:hypothetical protein [Thermoanaerobaculia bacterium]